MWRLRDRQGSVDCLKARHGGEDGGLAAWTILLLSRAVQCAVRTSTGTGRVLRRDVHNEKTLTTGAGDGGQSARLT